MSVRRDIRIAAIGGVVGLTIPIISLLMDVGSLGIEIVQSWSPLLVKKTDRFYCELREDTNINGQVWTVMYDNGNNRQPWLGMLRAMDGNWKPLERCERVAGRLNSFREDGLVALEYRDDSKTPNQEVICAKTQLSGDACPLLLTLDVGVDGYQALRDIIEALRNGTTVYQNSEGILAKSNFSGE